MPAIVTFCCHCIAVTRSGPEPHMRLFCSAIVFFLVISIIFCLLLIYSFINFLSIPFLVHPRAVFTPWKEIQSGSWCNYYHKLSGDLQLANLSLLVNHQFPRQNSGNYLRLLYLFHINTTHPCSQISCACQRQGHSKVE